MSVTVALNTALHHPMLGLVRNEVCNERVAAPPAYLRRMVLARSRAASTSAAAAASRSSFLKMFMRPPFCRQGRPQLTDLTVVEDIGVLEAAASPAHRDGRALALVAKRS